MRYANLNWEIMMMKSKSNNYMKNVIYILALAILFSCGKSQETKDKEKNEKKEQEQKIRDDAINSIAKKYNATFLWDTIDFAYTFEYDTVLNTPSQVIDRFYIDDISWKEKDSSYHISLRTKYSTFFFDLTTSDNNLDKLISFFPFEYTYCNSKYDSSEYRSDVLLIVKIFEIEKPRFKISSEVDDYDPEDISSYLTIDASDVFMGKGNLVDIVKLKK